MKKTILLIFMAFLFSSCLQNKMAIKQLLKSMGTKAEFFRPLTSAEYQRLFNNLHEKEKKYISECLPNLEEILNEGIQEELRSISGNVCECKAWGQCGKEVCSCEIICPDSLKIFDTPTVKDGSFHMDQLNIYNADIDLISGGSLGYCWGIAVVNQRFQRLAQFKPFDPPAYDLKTFDPNRKKYFQEIFNKLSNNEPVEIPGFSSIYEFSSHPEVREIMIESIRKTWVESAMTSQGVDFLLDKKQMSEAEFNQVADDIKSRNDLNLSPTILFNSSEKFGLVHALQVKKVVVNNDGSKTLCLIDNNLQPIFSTDCIQQINFKNGTMKLTLDKVKTGLSYEIDNIKRIQIAHTEDSSTVEQAHNLRKKCENEKDCAAKQ